MTNLITLMVVVISLLSLALGIILGLARGLKHSVLRLILVIAAFIMAILLREKVSEAVFAMEIGGETIEATLLGIFPEDFQSYAAILIPALKLIVGVFVYILIFLVLQVITLIVFMILKIFIRNKGESKHRLFGGIVGLLQGAFVAFALCFAISGLSVEVAKISEVEMNNQKMLDLSEVEVAGMSVDVQEYNETTFGKIYSRLGSKLFGKITTLKVEDNKTVTLNGQIESIIYTIKIADEISSITKIDLASGLNDANINDIKAMLQNLDALKGEMSAETVDTINGIISEVASNFELPLDVSNFDLTNISFQNESNILETAYNYQETGEIEDVGELVESLANSNLILPLASSGNLEIPLDDDQKAEIAVAIDNLENVDEEKINSLKQIFGLSTGNN